MGRLIYRAFQCEIILLSADCCLSQ